MLGRRNSNREVWESPTVHGGEDVNKLDCPSAPRFLSVFEGQEWFDYARAYRRVVEGQEPK